MTHEQMSSLVAIERRAFTALALCAAAVVALLLVAVTGVIVLEPHPMHLPGASHGVALDALVTLILLR